MIYLLPSATYLPPPNIAYKQGLLCNWWQYGRYFFKILSIAVYIAEYGNTLINFVFSDK